MFKIKARIVRDRWLGYEVQIWRWWWPFWVQANFSNTHTTIEGAERFAKEYLAFGPEVVKTVTL